VAEILLVLLAIEGHLRHIAASQSSVVQAAQQPTVVAQLTTIAQNTRYTADDMLKTSRLLETLIADMRRRFP
jgi:3-hydroxyisobutyrate dehydrogenase-like beta-hydroxyacid dehydrogenase